MIVDLFIPCYIDQYYPQTALNMVKILERLGVGVNYNPEQTCCGRPAFEEGQWDLCKELGEKFISEFMDERMIVCPAVSCVSTLRIQYQNLFHNSALHNEYKLIRKNVFELCDFLVNKMNASDLGASLTARAIYLDPCPGRMNSDSADAARMLLSKVKGLEVLKEEFLFPCCGAGGSVGRNEETQAVNMASVLLNNVHASGATLIISSDYQCLMHLQGVMAMQDNPIETLHIADVLASGWT